MKKIKPYLIFSMLLGIAACGGGSGSNEVSKELPPKEPPPKELPSTESKNIAPVSIIQAKNNLTPLIVGTSIVLDGSESTDDHSSTLKYQWSVKSKPENSNPSIGSTDAKFLDFTPDIIGTYEVSLIVNDGELDSPISVISIQVVEKQITQPPTESGKVVFRDGFWTGTILVDKANVNANDYTWSSIGLQMANSSSAEIVKDPAGSGQNVAKFTVPDDGQSYRAEIQRKQFDWGHYNYSVSHYIPSAWPLFDYGTILSQWHGYSLNSKNLNPPIALVLNGKKPEWQLHVYQLKPLSSPSAVPETILKRYVLDVPVTFDQWNNWNFDIKWSQLDSNNQLIPGLIVVKHNDKEVARISGENNYHQAWPPYFQMGIYRASWKEGVLNRPIGGQPIVVFHKDVVIKDLN